MCVGMQVLDTNSVFVLSSRKLTKQNDQSRFSSEISYEHFDSGVRMGNGLFNLVENRWLSSAPHWLLQSVVLDDLQSSTTDHSILAVCGIFRRSSEWHQWTGCVDARKNSFVRNWVSVIWRKVLWPTVYEPHFPLCTFWRFIHSSSKCSVSFDRNPCISDDLRSGNANGDHDLCQMLVERNLQIFPNVRITFISKEQKEWQIAGHCTTGERIRRTYVVWLSKRDCLRFDFADRWLPWCISCMVDE